MGDQLVRFAEELRWESRQWCDQEPSYHEAEYSSRLEKNLIKTLIFPAFLYGMETWILQEKWQAIYRCFQNVDLEENVTYITDGVTNECLNDTGRYRKSIDWANYAKVECAMLLGETEKIWRLSSLDKCQESGGTVDHQRVGRTT